MGRSLILNASYEPLSVVSVRRALMLVLNEKAELVHSYDGELRAPSASFPMPSVVRLHRFVRVPYRHRAPLSRRAVFVRDEFRCQYCGRAAENIDHVVPRSRGGQHVWENVVAACRRCNAAKEDRYLHETHLRLVHEPSAPRHTIWIDVAVGRVDPTWQTYLDEERGMKRVNGRHLRHDDLDAVGA